MNSFVHNAPFLYPLKTPENLKVFWRFEGVQRVCIGNKWIKWNFLKYEGPNAEALAWRCSVKNVFLKTLQNSQENTCARDLAL